MCCAYLQRHFRCFATLKELFCHTFPDPKGWFALFKIPIIIGLVFLPFCCHSNSDHGSRCKVLIRTSTSTARCNKVLASILHPWYLSPQMVCWTKIIQKPNHHKLSVQQNAKCATYGQDLHSKGVIHLDNVTHFPTKPINTHVACVDRNSDSCIKLIESFLNYKHQLRFCHFGSGHQKDDFQQKQCTSYVNRILALINFFLFWF